MRAADAKILRQGAIEEVGGGEELAHLTAHRGELKGACRLAVIREPALEVVVEPGQYPQESGLPGAVKAGDDHARPRGDVERDAIDRGRRRAGIAIAQVVGAQCHPGPRCRGERRAAIALDRKFRDVPGLVDRGEDVVERAEREDQLLDPGHHHHDDDLGGDELPQRDLAVDDQQRAEDQHGADHHRLEDHHPHRLLYQHAEVGLAVVQIVGDVTIHPLDRERAAPREFEGGDRAADFLQPPHGGVLVRALGDRRRQAAGAGYAEDQRQHGEQQQREGGEVRVIEGEQHQPEEHLQGRRGRLGQQLGQRLLDNHRLEEAVHHLGQIFVADAFEPDPRQSEGELEGEPRENALLEQLDHAQLQELQHPRGEGPEDDEEDQQHDRLQDQAAGDEAGDRLHPKRQREVDEAVERGVEVDQADVAALAAQQLPQPLHRRQMRVVVLVGRAGPEHRLDLDRGQQQGRAGPQAAEGGEAGDHVVARAALLAGHTRWIGDRQEQVVGFGRRDDDGEGVAPPEDGRQHAAAEGRRHRSERALALEEGQLLRGRDLEEAGEGRAVPLGPRADSHDGPAHPGQHGRHDLVDSGPHHGTSSASRYTAPRAGKARRGAPGNRPGDRGGIPRRALAVPGPLRRTPGPAEDGRVLLVLP